MKAQRYGILLVPFFLLVIGSLLFNVTETRYPPIVPNEGISTIYSDNIVLSNVTMNFYATDQPKHIDINADFELKDNKTGVIAFVLPYLSSREDMTAYWTYAPIVEKGYALMYKQFPCHTDDKCDKKSISNII